MTDEPVADDPVVGTALRLLPVPDHEPGFWDRVSSALAAEEPPAAALPSRPEPLVATPLAAVPAGEEPPPRQGQQPADAHRAVVPVALRRGSNLFLSAVAVAAAVVVVVAGTALVRDRTDRPATQQAAPAPDQGSPEAGADRGAASTAAVDEVTDADREAATSAVTSWLDALAAGDTDAAWDALGPASREHWGSQAAFAEEGTALADDHGAWAAARPDLVVVTAAGAGDDGRLLVVTLFGVAEREGAQEQQAAAYAVRLTRERAELEPWADLGPIEVVSPASDRGDGDGRTLDAGGEIVVVVPAGASAPTVVVDAGPPVVCGTAPGSRLTDLEGASGQRCAVAPPAPLEAGPHVLTVAATSPDGARISAAAVAFEAP